nr:putative ribonuclease H-like domain-containing protein [Tanacetum cinerariifolium]
MLRHNPDMDESSFFIEMCYGVKRMKLLCHKGLVYYDLCHGGKALAQRENVGFDLTKSVVCPSFIEDLTAKGVSLRMTDSHTGNHREDDFTTLETIQRFLGLVYYDFCHGGKALAQRENIGFDLTKSIVCPSFIEDLTAKGVSLRMTDSHTGNHREDDFTTLETIRRFLVSYCLLVLRRQVVVDNAINQRARELLKVIEQMRGGCDVINEKEQARVQECTELNLKVVSKVGPYVAMELVQSNDMGKLVVKLVSSAIFYGRCHAFQEVASVKEPFDIIKIPHASCAALISKKFKNRVMNEFCKEKGIKREYIMARTPQENEVAERRNRTLIENKPMITGGGPEWLFDIDALSELMNYALVLAGINSNDFAGKGASFDAEDTGIFDDAYDDRDKGAEVDYNN